MSDQKLTDLDDLDPDEFLEKYERLTAEFGAASRSSDPQVAALGSLGLKRMARIRKRVRSSVEKAGQAAEPPTKTHEAVHLHGTDVAKLVRAKIRRAWPGTKFYVRTQGYSTVTVCWQDGPAEHEVQTLIGDLHGKGFDGAVDLGYYIYHWQLPDGSLVLAYSQGTEKSNGAVPGFNYPKPDQDARLVQLSANVHVARAMTPGFAERLANHVYKQTGVPMPPIHKSSWFPGPKPKGEEGEFITDPREPLHRFYRDAAKNVSESDIE